MFNRYIILGIEGVCGNRIISTVIEETCVSKTNKGAQTVISPYRAFRKPLLIKESIMALPMYLSVQWEYLTYLSSLI